MINKNSDVLKCLCNRLQDKYDVNALNSLNTNHGNTEDDHNIKIFQKVATNINTSILLVENFLTF